MKLSNVLAGATLALGARALLPRALLIKFSGDLAKLNVGDHTVLLDAYADDFVLHFAEGPHRWSGGWVGKAGMERFLQNFTARAGGAIRPATMSEKGVCREASTGFLCDPPRAHQARLVGEHDQLGAVAGAELAHRAADVGTRGRRAEEELRGDLLVA